MTSDKPGPIVDLHPPEEDLAAQVMAGLSATPPALPSKLFYDEAGSRLFEQITQLPEYYPTRTELGILDACRTDLAEAVGDDIILVEYGSGSTTKFEHLLDGLRIAAYVPIDISRWYLETATDRLGRRYPHLEVRPVLADYSQPVPLPERLPPGARVGFFPGGTIGNFTPTDAVRFLQRVADTLGQGEFLVIGVDLKKDPLIVHAAYNDDAGTTAAFNLNLLARLNRDLGADFDLDQWRHYAPYVPASGRIEMHLVTLDDQRVSLAGRSFTFDRGTSIHTENSHKYTRGEFAAIADRAGFVVERFWTDPRRLFSVQLLRVR